MYVILSRNGVTLAADGPNYVVLVDGREVWRGMHKGQAEAVAKGIAQSR